MKFCISISFLFLFFFTSALNGQNKIIISDSGMNTVRSFDLITQELTIIDDNINTPRGIRVDNTNKLIFYTNGTDDRSIRRFDMETSIVDTLLPGLDSPSRIAIDEGAGIIYFTERLIGEIYKVNYDGTGVELIGSLPFANIIEIDTTIGKLFVSVSSKDIYSMNLDGSSAELIHNHTRDLYDINLDIKNKHIYYVQSGLPGTIIRMNYDGTETEVVYEYPEEIVHVEFDCAANKIYFITRGNGSVHELDLSSGTATRLTYITVNTSGAIALEQINTCQLSSVKNHYVSSDISIAPNPVSTELRISYLGQLPEKYSILDIHSRVIESGTYKSDRIDVSGLQSGQYLFLLTNGNTNYVSKFIKI